MFSDGGKSMILKAEPNITFEFYLESSMELYESATTDATGRLSVKLPYGTYIVKQKPLLIITKSWMILKLLSMKLPLKKLLKLQPMLK